THRDARGPGAGGPRRPALDGARDGAEAGPRDARGAGRPVPQAGRRAGGRAAAGRGHPRGGRRVPGPGVARRPEADRPAAVQPVGRGVAADLPDPQERAALPGDVLEHGDGAPGRPGARLGRDLLREGRRDGSVYGGHRDGWTAGRPAGRPRPRDRVRPALRPAAGVGGPRGLTVGSGLVGWDEALRSPTAGRTPSASAGVLDKTTPSLALRVRQERPGSIHGTGPLVVTDRVGRTWGRPCRTARRGRRGRSGPRPRRRWPRPRRSSAPP